MITIIIISSTLSVFFIGFVVLFKRHSSIENNIAFAIEYHKRFVEFASKYYKNYNQMGSSGDFDGTLYVWLLKNINKIQNCIGGFGEMIYQPAFRNYIIPDYPIILNTIPKFRTGQVERIDSNAVDDCLIRYIGHQEDYRKETIKYLRNPIIWFREGFREILSIPFIIFNLFGILSNRTVNSLKNSLIYKVVSGLFALVTLISGLVTIIMGYDQTIEFVNRLIGK